MIKQLKFINFFRINDRGGFLLLWSIQTRNVYDILMKDGVYHTDPQKSLADDSDFPNEMSLFHVAYDWISEQMRVRIGVPPSPDITYPVWAFYQWEGKRKRLDMRTHRVWGLKGTPIVLLTLDIPKNMVLLSDFDAWHCVLNDWFLPMNEKEELLLQEQADSYSNVDERENVKKKSWENVFLWDKETEYWSSPKTTQATFWELKKEWVKKAEFYLSK